MLKLVSMRLKDEEMRQNIQIIDYAREKSKRKVQPYKNKKCREELYRAAITSVEEKAQRRLEVKERSNLMMAIPNEHQLKFNCIKDAKKLLKAVKKRFGGNAATKKTQRNLLKQQYENFTTLRSDQAKEGPNYALVAFSSLSSNSELRKKLEIVQKEKDGIQLNVDKFEHASKSLNKLIECQIVDNCKKGLGYENYNAVPPPYIGNFMPPTPDLSFTGLDEFVNKPVGENCKAMSSKEEHKVVRKCDDVLSIEEWVSDDEEERVKKLEKKNRSRTHKLKRLYKVGLTARVESSSDEENLGKDASKQGRRINAIDADEDITLVSVQHDANKEIFDVDTLDGEEVFVAGQNENVVEEVVDAAQVSTAAITVTITTEEITLAQALADLKSTKPKAKGIAFREPGESTTTIFSQQLQDKGLSQDKGKGILVEPEKPLKKKDQLKLDEEIAPLMQSL
ncbi:hypothetical protein Tco_1192964 [Tanacetum coccineum]